ncbi:MAG TPA: ABC transporter permease subunit [Egicoccus sp.]|nr:ABC transporter permease subunit [Egicoccus sp.]HSK25099.1 ABC transporter permease subunit [Egicoccus sp.]
MPDIRILPIAQSFVPDLDVGGWVESGLGWLVDTFGVFFTFMRQLLGWLVERLEVVFGGPPFWVIVLVFALIALVAKGWKFALFIALAFTFVESMGHFQDTMLSLALVLVAALLAVVLGVPLGILAARNETASTLIRPMLDFMQTMPAFVYLVLAMLFFRIGVVPGVIASLLFAMPPAVRLTELGIRQVDPEVVEAAHAFGAKPREVLTGVQLPLAMPSIMAGINQVIMLALSMVVIAGMAGAGGLGGVIVEGITRLNFGLGVEGGLAVVVLAIFLDRITATLGTNQRSGGGLFSGLRSRVGLSAA